MRLVVDASVLVGELLRAKGRMRLEDDRLELFLAEHCAGEVHAELPKRVRKLATHRGLSEDEAEALTKLCFDAIDDNVVVIGEAAYSPLEEEATRRSARDPGDWPTVACALVVDAAIWTRDNDFLGTGVATWTTQTLQLWLDHTGSA